VVNGRRVLELEMSKVDQHAALRAAGFDVPRTYAVIGDHREAGKVARRLPLPFISKDNQGGKGLGVQRFDSYEAFDRHLAGGFVPPVDGTLLLQEYLEPLEPRITRVEIIGGRFHYAITADTSGGFELCPADACAVDDAFCPADPAAKFQLREGFTAADAEPWVRFARDHDIGIAGFEFIETSDGRRVTYDINTNTNYNREVEAMAALPAATAIARFLGGALGADGRVGTGSTDARCASVRPPTSASLRNAHDNRREAREGRRGAGIHRRLGSERWVDPEGARAVRHRPFRVLG
jgi:hypothetical protein